MTRCGWKFPVVRSAQRRATCGDAAGDAAGVSSLPPRRPRLVRDGLVARGALLTRGLLRFRLPRSARGSVVPDHGDVVLDHVPVVQGGPGPPETMATGTWSRVV